MRATPELEPPSPSTPAKGRLTLEVRFKEHQVQKHCRYLSERRANLFNPAWQKLSRFSTTVFTSPSEENLVPDKCLEARLGVESGL
ncbi:hypothetical protein AVEN_140145-1 [Araneus ventricosus]|uniref:Uncharacterized protein n=1 Tax=Araneus ventricosus TaxID=182803 RepID=A0A4Y2FVC9_ARAVE|nr:hypothetical protein AVEN_140145-1 [Araneus ventricosus]